MKQEVPVCGLVKVGSGPGETYIDVHQIVAMHEPERHSAYRVTFVHLYGGSVVEVTGTINDLLEDLEKHYDKFCRVVIAREREAAEKPAPLKVDVPEHDYPERHP